MSDIAHNVVSTQTFSSLVLLDSGVPAAPERGKHYVLEKSHVVIGTSDAADIQMPPHVMEESHGLLQQEDGAWWLFDLTKTNSVSMNAIPAGSFPLEEDGQIFQIGKSVFKFLKGKGYESECFAELYHRDLTDFLTNVYNKRYFHLMLDKEVTRAARYGRPMSLILIDLDEFGKLNKTLGQLAGDAVLKETAFRMQQCMRNHDILGRVGGEEFSVILPETTLDQTREIAERLKDKLRESPCVFEDKQMQVTLSAGIALFAEGMTGNQLVQEANKYLHIAKANGRNQVAG